MTVRDHRGRRGARLCVGLVAALMGSVLTPATAWAQAEPGAADREPTVTATRLDELGELVIDMDAKGRLLTSEGTIWHEGEAVDQVQAPPGSLYGTAGVVDMADRGRAVLAFTPMPPTACERPFIGTCQQPFVWKDGETTLLPTDRWHGQGRLVADRGRVVAGLRLLEMPGGPLSYEVVAWVDGELVHHPALPEGTFINFYGTEALNDSGQLALLANVDGVVKAAVWDIHRGRVRVMDQRSGESRAVDINDDGIVVGYAGDRGFAWQGRRVVDLGPIQPTDINDRGDIVGWCPVVGPQPDTAVERELCLWRHGELRTLGSPPVAHDSVFEPGAVINERGQIAGWAIHLREDVPLLAETAFLWDRGRFVDLGAVDPSNVSSRAEQISERGHILGSVVDELGMSHDVLWTIEDHKE